VVSGHPTPWLSNLAWWASGTVGAHVAGEILVQWIENVGSVDRPKSSCGWILGGWIIMPVDSSRPSLLFAFRWSGVGCGARLPLLYFFDRGLAAVSPSLSDLVDSAGGDPVPDSPGEGGGVGLYRLPSPGARAVVNSSLQSRAQCKERKKQNRQPKGGSGRAQFRARQLVVRFC